MTWSLLGSGGSAEWPLALAIGFGGFQTKTQNPNPNKQQTKTQKHRTLDVRRQQVKKQKQEPTSDFVWLVARQYSREHGGALTDTDASSS
jgi:hypothetical protein